MLTEQAFLRFSIIVTVVVASLGVAFGLLSGSYSIAFDGVYSLIDAGMTLLALGVSSLIVKSGQDGSVPDVLRTRFSMGFWHLEPIVLVMNGTLLMAVAIYALMNAVISILNGGHELQFGLAIVYALVTFSACVVMAVLGARANRRLKSDFIGLDVKAWAMSGGITFALLAAFLIGNAVSGTSWEWVARYVDPVALALVCLVVIPLPIGTVRQALSDILLIAPSDLKTRVDEAAAELVERHHLLSHRAYVAKIGRSVRIELYFVVPKGPPGRSIEDYDRMRDEIGRAIGGEGHDRWLTVVFTADPRWTE